MYTHIDDLNESGTLTPSNMKPVRVLRRLKPSLNIILLLFFVLNGTSFAEDYAVDLYVEVVQDIHSQRYDEAEQKLKERLISQPGDHVANYLSGVLYDQKIDFLKEEEQVQEYLNRAKIYYKNALDIQPENKKYAVYYARVLMENEEHKAAIDMYQGVFQDVEWRKDYDASLFKIAVSAYVQSLVEMKRYDTAISLVSRWMPEYRKSDFYFSSYIQPLMYRDFQKAEDEVKDYIDEYGFSELLKEQLCFYAKENEEYEYALNCYKELKTHFDTSQRGRAQ